MSNHDSRKRGVNEASDSMIPPKSKMQRTDVQPSRGACRIVFIDGIVEQLRSFDGYLGPLKRDEFFSIINTLETSDILVQRNEIDAPQLYIEDLVTNMRHILELHVGLTGKIEFEKELVKMASRKWLLRRNSHYNQGFTPNTQTREPGPDEYSNDVAPQNANIQMAGNRQINFIDKIVEQLRDLEGYLGPLKSNDLFGMINVLEQADIMVQGNQVDSELPVIYIDDVVTIMRHLLDLHVGMTGKVEFQKELIKMMSSKVLISRELLIRHQNSNLREGAVDGAIPATPLQQTESSNCDSGSMEGFNNELPVQLKQEDTVKVTNTEVVESRVPIPKDDPPKIPLGSNDAMILTKKWSKPVNIVYQEPKQEPLEVDEEYFPIPNGHVDGLNEEPYEHAEENAENQKSSVRADDSLVAHPHEVNTELVPVSRDNTRLELDNRLSLFSYGDEHESGPLNVVDHDEVYIGDSVGCDSNGQLDSRSVSSHDEMDSSDESSAPMKVEKDDDEDYRVHGLDENDNATPVRRHTDRRPNRPSMSYLDVKLTVSPMESDAVRQFRRLSHVGLIYEIINRQGDFDCPQFSALMLKRERQLLYVNVQTDGTVEFSVSEGFRSEVFLHKVKLDTADDFGEKLSRLFHVFLKGLNASTADIRVSMLDFGDRHRGVALCFDSLFEQNSNRIDVASLTVDNPELVSLFPFISPKELHVGMPSCCLFDQNGQLMISERTSVLSLSSPDLDDVDKLMEQCKVDHIQLPENAFWTDDSIKKVLQIRAGGGRSSSWKLSACYFFAHNADHHQRTAEQWKDLFAAWRASNEDFTDKRIVRLMKSIKLKVTPATMIVSFWIDLYA